jgi:hypothetical protein
VRIRKKRNQPINKTTIRITSFSFSFSFSHLNSDNVELLFYFFGGYFAVLLLSDIYGMIRYVIVWYEVTVYGVI